MKWFILFLAIILCNQCLYGQQNPCSPKQKYVREIKKSILKIDKGSNSQRARALTKFKLLCLENKTKISICNDSLRIYFTSLLEKHGYFGLESFHGTNDFDVLDLYISTAFIKSDYYQNGAEFGSVWASQSHGMMLKRPDLLMHYLESFKTKEERIYQYRILSIATIPYDLFKTYQYRTYAKEGKSCIINL